MVLAVSQHPMYSPERPLAQQQPSMQKDCANPWRNPQHTCDLASTSISTHSIRLRANFPTKYKPPPPHTHDP